MIGEFFPQANLVGLWHLNGNSNDSSGNGNNGTDTNITYSLANGKFGQGAGFNGISSQIQLSTANFFGTNPATVIALAKTSTTGAIQDVFNFIFANPGISGGVYSDNKPFFYISNGTTSKLITGGTGSVVTDGNFHLFAWVKYATNNWKIFVDGAQVNSDTTDIAGTLDNTSNKYFGRNPISEWWNGSIDEVAVFNRALSASEIKKWWSWSKGRYI